MSGDSSDKTEKASPKKLRDARKKGQVARSNDIAPALGLLFTALYFWLTWESNLEQLKEMFLVIPLLYSLDFRQALETGLNMVISKGFWGMIMPFALLMMLSGLIGNLLQAGFVFAIDPILPRMEKINFATGFKRIFSLKQVVQTLLSLLKTLIVGAVVLIVFRIGIEELLHPVQQCNVPCQQTVIEYLTKLLIMFILPILIAVAVLDYIFQYNQFLKEQRMTKEELKREAKEIFGDPHVRGARQGMRREMAEQDIQQRIRTARLVILDMGMAIALQYEAGVTPLPVIVAIGKGMMARKMVEIATKENIALVSDSSLAQELADNGKLDNYIPESTITRVAQVMRRTGAGAKT